METYYTTVNFQIFIGAVFLLLLLLLLSASPFFFRLPQILRFSVWGMVVAVSVSALSRVCPYPGIDRLFRYIGFVFAAVSAALLLIGGWYWFRHTRKRGGLSLGDDEIDDRIVSFLAGRYLVIDPLGNILAGSLVRLDSMPEPKSTAFSEYVNMLAERYAHSPELRPFFDSLYHLENAEADLVSDKAFYRCRLSPLGNDGKEGFLFLVQDFTEEHQLLVRRGEQEKLASLRVKRIRDQGESEALSLRQGKTAGFIESFSKLVDSRMKNLKGSLESLAVSRVVVQEDVERTLEQCRRTMGVIRTAVHNIDTGEEFHD